MKIYTTPFTGTPPTATDHSTDSGFADFDEVISLMGEPDRRPAPAVLIYGGTCFTPTPLYLGERPQ